jgi:hypothetical protein
MQDFTGPGQAALGGVTALIQQNSQDDRAQAYLQTAKRQQIEKNFEVKSNLAQHMMATDPNAALELFNDGLRGFGVSVTMEQFRPAIKGFEAVADLMRGGDLQGAQLMLGTVKKNWTTNIQDAQRALEMEQTIRQQQSQSQAETVMRLQYPDIDRAQQTVNAYRGFQQGSVSQEDLTRLYGTTDMAEIGQKAAKDEAIVKGFEDHASIKQTLQTAFMNNPGLADDVTKASIGNMIDPEKGRSARIQTLLLNEGRTPKEEKELGALVLLSKNPALIEAMGLKSAMTEKIRITKELEDTGERLGAMQDAKGVLDAAEGAVASIDPKAAGLDSSKPMNEKAAQTYAKLTTIRLGESQKFLADNANRVKSLDAAMQDSQQQLENLSKQLVGAPPARREALQDQQTELTKTLQASQAMKRLLSTHNPYQLAAQEAAAATATDEGEKKQATASLTQMQQQREADLATVQDEATRLQRRQRLLQGHMTKADRDEDVERRLNQASTAVLSAMQKGTASYTQAFRQAKEVYGVNAEALKKQMDALRSDDLTQAQNIFALLPPSAQTPQNAARIGQKAGFPASQIMEGIKTPNGSLVTVNTGTKAQEEADKQFIQETRATYNQLKHAPVLLHNIEEAKALIPQAKGFMGPGGEGLLEAAKFLNNRLNTRINTEGIKSAEELRTRIFFNIMENLKKVDAQPSQMQQIIMMDSLGKLGTDPNALGNVLDAYGDTIRDKVQQFNKEVSGAQKRRGDLFPYDPSISLPMRKSPEGEPMPSNDEEYNQLPPGAIYIAPDGKRKQKR